MFRKMYLLCCIFVIAITLKPTNAQSSKVQIRFMTLQTGASLYLNDELVGTTPVELELETGTYKVEFHLAGFQVWSQMMLFYQDTDVSKSLQSNENLIYLPDVSIAPSIPVAMIDSFFSPSANQFLLRIISPNRYLFYDVDQGITFEQSTPPGYVAPENIPNAIKLPTPREGFYTNVKQSPTGRYYGFITGSDASSDSGFLTLYDSQRDVLIPTSVSGYLYQLGMGYPAITWSSNEQILAVGPNQFVIIDNDQAQVVSLFDFTDVDTQALIQVYDVNGVLSAPSNDAQVLVIGRFEDYSGLGFWMVDLRTKTGKLIPIDPVYGARFTPDGKQFYVATEEGILRVDSEDFTKQVLVTNQVAGVWGVNHVIFSPTFDYAIVTAHNRYLDTQDTQWLYLMPKQEN